MIDPKRSPLEYILVKSRKKYTFSRLLHEVKHVKCIIHKKNTILLYFCIETVSNTSHRDVIMETKYCKSGYLCWGLSTRFYTSNITRGGKTR
jgi:hypothetical protein